MGIKHQQVVVAFDFSALGPLVLARAVALVQRAPSHILHFINVVDPHAGVPAIPHKGPIDHLYADQVRELMSEQIRAAFGTTPIAEEIHFFVHARIGKPAKEILELAEEVGADLIMVGHGHTGLQRVVMGSTAEHVVREAGCPVIVVRDKRYGDVELATVTEVAHQTSHAKLFRFSYKNSNIVMRPPQWPIG